MNYQVKHKEMYLLLEKILVQQSIKYHVFKPHKEKLPYIKYNSAECILE